MSEFKSSSKEEFICISYYDTKDLPIDRHCIKYRNIKYDIQEVLERTDDIDYVISDSKTTRNLLKENERLNNIINEIHKLLRDTYKELSSYLPIDDNCELMSRIANMTGKIKELRGDSKC